MEYLPVTVDKSHLITIGERLYSESIELIRVQDKGIESLFLNYLGIERVRSSIKKLALSSEFVEDERKRIRRALGFQKDIE